MKEINLPNKITDKSDVIMLFNIIDEVPILNYNLWELSSLVLKNCKKSVNNVEYIGDEKIIRDINHHYLIDKNLMEGWFKSF